MRIKWPETMSIQFGRAMNAHRWIMAKLGQYAPIPLRLMVGYGFLAHGYAKIVRGPEHFINILHSIGVPAPELMGWTTILIELVGGLAVLVGAFVPVAIVPMAAVLLVAIFTVHLPYGFSSIKLQEFTAAGAQFGPPGYELDLLYLACLTTLALGGSGPFALDSILGRPSARRKQEVTPNHRSTTMSRTGCEQQTRTLPSAGLSSGSGP
jgi:putative oxidoreductase